MTKETIAEYILQATGKTATDIEIAGDIASFEMKTNQTALDVFPYDDDEPYYTMVNCEIDGDERGCYSEVLLFQKKPAGRDPGHLIEGLYRRPIQYRDEPDAEFYGTIQIVSEEEDWSALQKAAEERYNRRVAREHINFIGTDLKNLGRIMPDLGTGKEAEALRTEFRTLIADTMRQTIGDT